MDEARWRIPWPDWFGEICQSRFPRLGPWLADLETRTVSAERVLPEVLDPVYIGGLARGGSTMLLEWAAGLPGFTSHRYSDFPMLWTPYWWNRLLDRLHLPPSPRLPRAHGDGIEVSRDSPEAFEEPIWAHFLDTDRSRGDVLSAGDALPEFARVYRDHVAKLVAARGATRYVAKGNSNTLRFGWLAAAIPSAKFLVPLRRPDAHIASMLRQDALYATAPVRTLRHIAARGHHEFGPLRRVVHADAAQHAETLAAVADGRHADARCLEWIAVYDHAAQLARQEGLARRLRFVDQHALCRDPRTNLRELLAFLDIDDAAGRDYSDAFAPRFQHRPDQAQTQALSSLDPRLLDRAMALYRELQRED